MDIQDTSYCQMNREVNKEKRLKFAAENKDMTMLDTIYTDETTLQIETHWRTCSYKRVCNPHCNPKPKHPIKVHVWAGISHLGRIGLCIFKKKMNALLFISILRSNLLTFIKVRMSIQMVIA